MFILTRCEYERVSLLG